MDWKHFPGDDKEQLEEMWTLPFLPAMNIDLMVIRKGPGWLFTVEGNEASVLWSHRMRIKLTLPIETVQGIALDLAYAWLSQQLADLSIRIGMHLQKCADRAVQSRNE